MRLALVTETFPPEVNGVAMTLGRLTEAMARRGHAVQVVRPRQRRGDAPGRAGGIDHLTVPGLPLPRYDGLHVGLPARGRLTRAWRAHRPDVVHVATEGPLGITTLWAARRLGIPVSSSFHTNFHQYGQHYGYGLLARGVSGYLRHVHNQTACTMVPSRDVLETLRHEGFANLVVLARGVDSELFTPARRSEALRAAWGAGPTDLVAAYVGRVAQEKNIPLTVRAFEAMRAVDPSAKLVIVGDGPARPGLAKQHPEYHFAGMRSGEDLAAHYASADVFLFASVTETFGNVVSEALASGLAVVTYDYAAGRALIRDGHNGRLAAFDDAGAFCRAAAELARDRAALASLRAAARDSALGLSWSAVVDRFELALRQVIEQGRVTAPADAEPAA